jgi:hypothetical protein
MLNREQGEPSMTRIIETMKATDWEAVRAIYLEGIATRNATFETAAPDWEKWSASHLPFGRLVARVNDIVVGWGALMRGTCIPDGPLPDDPRAWGHPRWDLQVLRLLAIALITVELGLLNRRTLRGVWRQLRHGPGTDSPKPPYGAPRE